MQTQNHFFVFMQVLQMTFGDWEMFKAAVLLLRDTENKNIFQDKPSDVDNVTNNNNAGSKDMVRISVTSPGSPLERSSLGLYFYTSSCY